VDARNHLMTLADMKLASHGRVIAVSTQNQEFRSRLYALGLYPGVEINVLHFAPAGDPIQIRIGGTLLSIRRSEADHIAVEEMA
jgi:ferrous iron transport protein A